MSVVQRCPNCGTTQSDAGMCEACHEAEVRYFCTNHAPGVWLESSTCGQCGARAGQPELASSVAPPAAAVRTRVPPIARPARTSEPPPYTPAARPRAARDVDSERRREPRLEELFAPGASRMALLQKLVQALVRARYTPRRVVRERERARVGRAAGGCLMRVLLAVVLLLVALAGAAFVFGRALLGG